MGRESGRYEQGQGEFVKETLMKQQANVLTTAGLGALNPEEKATWATHMAVLSRWAYCPACVKRLGIPDDWDEHDKRIMLRKLRALGMTYAEYEAAWEKLIKEQLIQNPVIFKAIVDAAIRKFGMMRG